MTGDYDDHSEYQRRVVESGSSLVTGSIEGLALPDPPDPLVITDVGAGTGRNSMAALGAAVTAARARRRDLPIVCVHSDLPSNDWNALFSALRTSEDSYLHAEGPPVLPMASGQSFFEPVVPRGLAHLQVSFSAAHWLRTQPQVDVADGFYFSEAGGSARRTLAAQAADDWARFLQARAMDLTPGGRLLVQCVGTDVDTTGTEHVTARDLLRAMSAVALAMADEGEIARRAVEAYVFPVYARTVAEAQAPLERGGELSEVFEIVDISTAPVPNPYLDRWRTDGDRQRYGRDYAAFVRGFAESSLRTGLLETAGVDPPDTDRLLDDYFHRLETRFAADPERDAFRDWTLTVVLERR
jgi:cyclopropane-fatty-acyl-phospholipid synthase